MSAKQYGKASTHVESIHVDSSQSISGKTDALGRTLTVQSAAEENLQLRSPETPPKPKQTLYEVGDNTLVEYVMEFMEK
ncbi:hypothetical protein [Photorhabdus bodei]|uniref:Uncharacterized protein n=1 Tax=Photorhabdus bodei TaxID=2029681 RepID=A0AAW6BFD4_9GAMM|nr:hypothetical protein [Photorhabdus bodei]MCC8465691.1 hypothetical protein [Photorhabdus bodei]MDB6370657.1 hypothetical protein [Photorhabdus bodei]